MGALTDHFCRFRCDFDDIAQYRASAMNVKGEISAFASLVVKSRFAKYFRRVSLLRCTSPVVFLWLREPSPLGGGDCTCSLSVQGTKESLMPVFCTPELFPCLWAVSCNTCLSDASIYSCGTVRNGHTEYSVNVHVI